MQLISILENISFSYFVFFVLPPEERELVFFFTSAPSVRSEAKSAKLPGTFSFYFYSDSWYIPNPLHVYLKQSPRTQLHYY